MYEQMKNWHHGDEILPLPGQPVMVGKIIENGTILTGVGRIVLNKDTSLAGWLCTEDGTLRKLTARPFWIMLREDIPAILNFQMDEDLQSLVDEQMEKLAFFEKKFQALAAAMMISGIGLYPVDYYISGIINRGMSLIYGFETLMKSQNYLSAVHLVRPLLDNYLRLSAIWLVSNPHQMATDIWSGIQLDKIRDREGNRMRDSYLRDKAAEEFPWMKDVYNETSGFIHFSNKHIGNATRPSAQKDMTLETYFGKVDFKVSNFSRLEAINCMIEICNCISLRVFGWVDTKRLEKLQDTFEEFAWP
jgi:hypothetical protein